MGYSGPFPERPLEIRLAETLKPRPLTVTYTDVPVAAIAVLKTQLEAFGWAVTLDPSQLSGVIAGPSGKMTFTLDASKLYVTVTENAGHFPRLLLIGGIRQMIGEAVEIVTRSTKLASAGV